MSDEKKVSKTEEQWKSELTPEQYRVLREKGTEPVPQALRFLRAQGLAQKSGTFTGKYYKNHEKGMYMCGACGAPLFSSDTKFDSGSGWPSFWNAVDEGAVELHGDTSHGMNRVEAVCSRCGSHLGHVFDDGPQPTGKRYCINSCALDFKKNEEV